MTEDEKQELRSDVRARVNWVLDDFAGRTRRYAYLEERTGIAARKWKNMCNGVTQPSVEMLEALALVRPYLATWLLTGHALGDQLDPCQDDDIGKALFEKAIKKGLDESAGGELQEESRDTKAGVFLRRDSEGKAEVNIGHAINLRAPYDPAGFEWGYNGQGPCELAANILYHFGLSEEKAKKYAQKLCDDVISNLPHAEAFISAMRMEEWIRSEVPKAGVIKSES